jgi:hypothetical protein
MKIRINLFNMLVGILFLISFNSLIAQDAHYWNIEYGTRSTLLGGAVIGSVSDLSATYYNPGAVALFPDRSFVLSARVYQLETISVEDGAGAGRQLDYSTIVPSPSFVAFDIKFDFLGDAHLAVSLLTRQSMNFEFRTRLIESIDVIPSSPGTEDFAGGISIDRTLGEIWGGLTYSSKLNETIGIGLTGYIAHRNQTASKEIIVQVLPNDSSEILSLTDIVNYNYNNIRALLKFGIGFNFQPLTLGLTVTTPSLNIAGSGSVGTHFFLNGADANNNVFDSNFQDDVASDYKSSWAVGAGGGYRFGNFKVHFSTEWYNAVDLFTVLNTEPYISQGSGDTLTNDLTLELKSVTNYGIGFDFFSTEDLTFSGSFVTDFSARVPGTQTELAVSTWNFYHISGGATFKLGKSDFTLGLEYAFGTNTVTQPIDLTDPNAPESADLVNESKVKARRIKLLLGFKL